MKTTMKVYLMLLVAVMSVANVKAQAQYYPPQIQWNKTFHFEDPPQRGDLEDWIYQAMQASDGGYVGVGYLNFTNPADGSWSGDFPSIEKIDASGNVVWKYVCSSLWTGSEHPSTFPYDNGAPLKDVIESTMAPEYIAVGDAAENYPTCTNPHPAFLRGILFVKMDINGDGITASDGTQTGVENYETIIHLPSPYCTYSAAFSILEYNNSFYIYGIALDLATNYYDIVLIKVDQNGNRDNSFGVKVIAHSSLGNSAHEDFEGKLNFWRDENNVPQGFLITGGIGTSHTAVEDYTNGILVRTDFNGNIIAQSTFDGTNFYSSIGITSLTSLGYQHIPSTIHCRDASCVTLDANTGIYNGYEAKQLPPNSGNPGDVILSARINWNYRGTDYCDIPKLQGEYMTYESVLFKLNGNLDPMSAKSMGQVEGKDFHSEIEIDDGANPGIVLLGVKASNQRIQNYLVKCDYNFNVMWKKIFNDGYQHIDNRPNLENCAFALVRTKNNSGNYDGYFVGGNNEMSGEDYMNIKLVYGNCRYDVDNILDMQTYVPLNGEVIDNDVFIDDCIINPGVTLTIKKPDVSTPVNVYFNSTVIIKAGGAPPICPSAILPGGKLVVDGAKLTGGNLDVPSCTPNLTTWNGIEILGDVIHDQNPLSHPLYQGKLEMRNGAEISNALTAITLDDNGTVPFGGAGGLVQATDAVFNNNWRTLISVFNPYISNKSSFTRCTFKVDDNCPNPVNFQSHVYFWWVKGTRFVACDFQNNQTGKTWDLQKNKAIYSLDAGYTVSGTCGLACANGPCAVCPPAYFKPTKFTGFNIAIDAKGSGTTSNVNIDWSEFDDNVIGVQIDKQDNCWVTRSKFSVGENNISGIPANIKHHGIAMLYSTGYRIEDNNLETPTTIVGQETWGINVQHNGGTSDNRVYNNTCTNLLIGERSFGMNRSISGISGLQFLCNKNSNPVSTDFDIRIEGQGQFDGIRYQQGDAVQSISTGNTFSYANPSGESDISNPATNGINYWYDTGLNKEPQYFTPILVTKQPATTANACLSNYSAISWAVSATDIWRLSAEAQSQLNNDYDDAEESYINTLYSYSQLIDGGSTTALLLEIENSWTQEAWDLRNSLMGKSPYVSEDALKAAAVKGILPDAMLLEVCLANPDATRSKDFIDFLRDRIPNPLPEYMLDLIVANWSQQTPRTILEGALASYGSKMAFSADLLLADLMLDDSLDTREQIRYWLSRRDVLADRYMLSESWFGENQYDSASASVSNIPNDFRLKDALENEYYNYLDYLAFRKEVFSKDKTIMQLDSMEINALQVIAGANTGNSSAMARNILCFGYGLCDEDTSRDGGSRIAHYPRRTSLSESIVTAYPNPASSFSAFDWNISSFTGTAKIKITDAIGRIIEQMEINKKQGEWIWDVRKVENGVYLFEVTDSGKNLASGKVVVAKQ